MKKLTSVLLVLIPGLLLASVVVCYDTTTLRLTRIIQSADTLQYQGRPGYLVNPKAPTNFQPESLQFYWVSNGAITRLPQELLDFEWLAQSNAIYLDRIIQRSNDVRYAAELINGETAEARVMRSFALIVLDQINQLRQNPNTAYSLITTQQFLTVLSNMIIDLNR